MNTRGTSCWDFNECTGVRIHGHYTIESLHVTDSSTMMIAKSKLFTKTGELSANQEFVSKLAVLAGTGNKL